MSESFPRSTHVVSWRAVAADKSRSPRAGSAQSVSQQSPKNRKARFVRQEFVGAEGGPLVEEPIQCVAASLEREGHGVSSFVSFISDGEKVMMATCRQM